MAQRMRIPPARAPASCLGASGDGSDQAGRRLSSAPQARSPAEGRSTRSRAVSEPASRCARVWRRRSRVSVVSLRVVAASVAVTALVLLSSWIFELPLERAALLAPVLVVGFAAAAGLVVLWGRVGWEQYRESRHPV